MNMRLSVISIVSAAVLICGSSFALQDKTDPAKGKPTEASMPMPKPTKEHEWLKSRIGSWEATVSCPMMGAPTKGTETTKAFGDFSIVADFKGQMMGQDFTGLSVMTYDPIRRKYVSTWCDTMYPAIAVFEGTMDSTGRKLTSTGKAPNMENTLVDWTSVLEVKGPDEAVFTMYETSKGPDDESAMRIDYKRKK